MLGSRLAAALALGAVLLASGCSNEQFADPLTCGTPGWNSSVYADKSRPEVAVTTLRSANEIGRDQAKTCAQIVLACRRTEGPYFELRLMNPQLKIKEVGQIRVDISALQGTDLSIGQDPVDGGQAVRTAEKDLVEVIAQTLVDSWNIRVPITLADGQTGTAQFNSRGFHAAARTVLFACDMRNLSSDEDDEDDDDDDDEDDDDDDAGKRAGDDAGK